ncbi:hypothetical protein [Nannocystis bainbridge]|uniref:Uncharacterized protein n=1 Tax=Nannocystis bainbridge TaxID=2995303 RepID=A0ABT5DV50_9BACT|nr:hypothetical protein [Nannocystis bainbridge]MDC0717520.1 hypothetical protein [Nannocystis bainbridge]
MGWYTTNADDTFQWKYGDVVALARASGLGALVLLPRLQVVDEDGEFFDGEEFIGPIQQWAIEQELPWEQPILFDRDDGHDEAVPVPGDVDVTARLEQWARVLRTNRASLIAALRHFNDVDHDAFVRASLATEAIWRLPESDYGALIAWLNEPLVETGAPRFSLEDLREGDFDDDEYEPSEATQAALDALPAGDDTRVMAAHALGHALVEGSPLELCQPGDSYSLALWGDEDDE